MKQHRYKCWTFQNINSCSVPENITYIKGKMANQFFIEAIRHKPCTNINIGEITFSVFEIT